MDIKQHLESVGFKFEIYRNKLQIIHPELEILISNNGKGKIYSKMKVSTHIKTGVANTVMTKHDFRAKVFEHSFQLEIFDNEELERQMYQLSLGVYYLYMSHMDAEPLKKAFSQM